MIFSKTAIPGLVVGWGVPLLVVSISSSIGLANGTYMSKTPKLLEPLPDNNKYQRCWLNKNNHILFVGGLLVPVAAPLILNLLILIKVGYFVFWMSKKTDNFKPSDNRSNRKQNVIGKNKEHIKASLKGCVVLLPVLGVPWILLLLTGMHMYVTFHMFWDIFTLLFVRLTRFSRLWCSFVVFFCGVLLWCSFVVFVCGVRLVFVSCSFGVGTLNFLWNNRYVALCKYPLNVRGRLFSV